MKQRITITGPDGKKTTGEFTLRDPEHLRLTLKFKSSITKTKKGKGSYTRKEKHKKCFVEEVQYEH